MEALHDVYGSEAESLASKVMVINYYRFRTAPLRCNSHAFMKEITIDGNVLMYKSHDIIQGAAFA